MCWKLPIKQRSYHIYMHFQSTDNNVFESEMQISDCKWLSIKIDGATSDFARNTKQLNDL